MLQATAEHTRDADPLTLLSQSSAADQPLHEHCTALGQLYLEINVAREILC